MPDYHFIAQSPLGGYKKNFAGIAIAERTDCWITSIGIPANRQKELAGSLQDAFNIQVPDMGRLATARFANLHLLGLQKNQWFLVSESPLSSSLADSLKQNMYLAAQSDSWVVLSVTGEKCRQVLARICPVDLHPTKFTTDKVVRTLMAHLGVVIYRPSENGFCLLAPRSSAGSFLQALEAAANAVLGDS